MSSSAGSIGLQMTTAPRLVTVCLNGSTAKSLPEKTGHLELLANHVEDLNNHWPRFDAIVFPGGFLDQNQNIDSLCHVESDQGVRLGKR